MIDYDKLEEVIESMTSTPAMGQNDKSTWVALLKFLGLSAAAAGMIYALLRFFGLDKIIYDALKSAFNRTLETVKEIVLEKFNNWFGIRREIEVKPVGGTWKPATKPGYSNPPPPTGQMEVLKLSTVKKDDESKENDLFFIDEKAKN